MAQTQQQQIMTLARRRMIECIEQGALTSQQISAIMTDTFGGTDAAGLWTWRLAFDVMQSAGLAVVARCLEGNMDSKASLAVIEDIASRLPTETRRSERQMQLQQFSTAMPWGWVAAQAAAVSLKDIILEPSAGVGCLAALAQIAGQTSKTARPRLVLNEIDPTRRDLLTFFSDAVVSTHNAEFIDDLLATDWIPDVVIMNPPFVSSSTRTDDASIAIRHVISAAKRMRPGGRLVAIVPPSVSAARAGDLWARLCREVTPVLRLCLPRAAFVKMGTSVETHLLVLEKKGLNISEQSNRCEVITVGTAQEALTALDGHLPARMRTLDQDAVPTLPRIGRSLTPTRAERRSMILPGVAARQSAARSSTAMVPLGLRRLEIPRDAIAVSEVYARYVPQRLVIERAGPHPTTLVESLAMASVAPPCPPEALAPVTLPDRILSEALLSDAQLETIVMAEAAFSSDLPGRFRQDEDQRLVRADDDPRAVPFRKGYFLGDGTGCGKGRQIAGLIMAGWGAGRRKALWISRSSTLIDDAMRDWTDLGGARTDIHALSRWSADETLTLHEGILFATYATLRAVAQSGTTRLDQVLEWLGDDFDGLIAFDEAHAMQNAGGAASARGSSAPSQQGLAGLRLQNAVPRARVLYVSATGATEVANLAYAGRLGLWGAGPGYPFPSREQFVEAMEAGGVAAMEVVARDLKALGLYAARALSFDGVEYDILEHQLTNAQIIVYDSWAQAFRTIHQNLQAALMATGVTAPEGSGEAGAGSAKAAAISAFESTKQRFFGHLLQGMKMATVIQAIQADIAEGWAPVVQIVSTGEALLKRRIESLAPDEELAEAALTPREYVLGYLQNAFPVAQMELVEQDDGSVLAVPLRDAQGAVVMSREAMRLRDTLIEDLMLLAPVPSALDQLVWAVGPEQVAEVTGRSQRPLRGRDGRLRVERRAASANAAEAQAFMSGQKSVLVFSDAGGTGRSYHAAETAVNQKRRRHYLLEPGWRADNAIQGLGRTHRSAQVCAPFFRVCTTDVHGEKRFTSTIARRLDTLGALTKGQRETASQGLFRAEDNLESPIARACLRGLLFDVIRGKDAPIGFDSFVDWTALKLSDKEGVPLEEMPPIQRFLNRILALPIRLQNDIFSSFMDRIAAATERARQAGTLDLGLEQLRGDRILSEAAQTLRQDDVTGAVTSLVPLRVERQLTYRSGAQVRDSYPSFLPMQNASSGKVAFIAPAPRHIFGQDGDLAIERKILRPQAESWIGEEDFERSQWAIAPLPNVLDAWDAEIAALPSVDIQQIYLLTGLILPIWRDIPGSSSRIYRATDDQGRSFLGRALSVEDAAILRGRYTDVDTSNPVSILEAVRSAAKVVDLGRGLSLASRRVAGHARLEITGADRPTLAWLRSIGCFTEIHQFTLRVFIPSGDDDVTLQVMGAIIGAGSALDAA